MVIRLCFRTTRVNLFARALAGGEVVSVNLYRLRSGKESMRPSEIPAEKVVAAFSGICPTTVRLSKNAWFL
jgi:hypothetical protein